MDDETNVNHSKLTDFWTEIDPNDKLILKSLVSNLCRRPTNTEAHYYKSSKALAKANAF